MHNALTMSEGKCPITERYSNQTNLMSLNMINNERSRIYFLKTKQWSKVKYSKIPLYNVHSKLKLSSL